MTTPPDQPPPPPSPSPPPPPPHGQPRGFPPPPPPRQQPATPGHQPQGQGFPGQGFQGRDFPPQGFQGYPQQLPPPPPGSTSRGAKALIGVVVSAIAVVVVAGFLASADSPSGAEAGECIEVVSVSVTDADVEKVECSSPEAAFTVAANLDSGTGDCPDGDYAEYSDSGGRRSDGFKLCLMLNAAQGECFKQEGTIVAGKTTKVTCDSGATHKVAKAVTGRADENECASGDTVFVYSQPATTVCLTEAGTGA